MLPLPPNKTGTNILLPVWELGPNILMLGMELGHLRYAVRLITLQELELCTFRPCRKFVTMHACGCDYAHLCHVVRL